MCIGLRSPMTISIPETGEVGVGRIVPATRVELRQWLTRFEGRDVVFATEGCTGWRFVVEELERAGVEAHVAEPADTATLRGRKKRAKTDRADARICAPCWWRTACRSRGSHRLMSSRCVPGAGSMWR
jgi:transposase